MVCPMSHNCILDMVYSIQLCEFGVKSALIRMCWVVLKYQEGREGGREGEKGRMAGRAGI